MTAEPWSVPRLWLGQTVACIASGPSLTREQVDAIPDDWRIISVNDSCFLPPDRAELNPRVDLVYACDANWWEHRLADPVLGHQLFAAEALRVKMLPGPAYLTRNGIRLRWLADGGWNEAEGIVGLDDRPTHLRNGRNGGYQAIHLAAHLGATRIVLLGYDLRVEPGGPDHWHGAHPHINGGEPDPRLPSMLEANAERFRYLVEPLAERGIEVVNATPGSAIECFPSAALDSLV